MNILRNLTDIIKAEVPLKTRYVICLLIADETAENGYFTKKLRFYKVTVLSDMKIIQKK